MKLTVKQAAERAGVSESLVYTWVRLRLLPSYRFGLPGKRGKVMIDEVDLEAYMATCRVNKAVPPEEGTLSIIR